MFGGYGLYAEGVMFALIAYETLYFKVDAENRDQYLKAGMGPFRYERHGKPIEMSYFQLPDPVLTDPAQLMAWIAQAKAAATRSKAKKAKRSRP
jgi:DNA transformation protein